MNQTKPSVVKKSLLSWIFSGNFKLQIFYWQPLLILFSSAFFPFPVLLCQNFCTSGNSCSTSFSNKTKNQPKGKLKNKSFF
jgi:hypothetical protein